MFKVSPNDTEGRPLFELGNGQWDIPQLRILLEDILPENDQFSDLVVDHVFQGIGAKTMLLNARRLRRNGGRPGLILLAIEDTTERTRADAHRDRLVDELSHRVKNTLATVQSLANRTIRQAKTLDQFRTAFDGRLQALARAYDLLVAENWTGADIGQLARWTLDPYRVDGDERITIEGPKLILAPKAGTAMVMILHELATNAAKYGALATPAGRLNVKWDLGAREGDREFQLSWTETGGQRVEPPTRQGFGTRLIEGSAAYELKGSAKLDFRAEGLHCGVTFPWDTAAAQEQEAE
jgi:two-component system CheB/CheR fusion protein